MRLLFCLFFLVQGVSAITQGRPMGDAPERYYLFNGQIVPPKIVRLGMRDDSLYDTLFIEELHYGQGLMGLCNRIPYENGAPSEYLYYYDSLNRIDMVRINVLDNDAEQAYANYSYGYEKRPDTLVADGEITADSIIVYSCEQKVAMIPGYPLEKFKKTESYVRVGDSTDTAMTVTTDHYRWLPGSQGGGYYRRNSVQKVIIKEGEEFDIQFPPKGGDTLFIHRTFSDNGDTLSEEATLLTANVGKVDLYRVTQINSSDTVIKKVEVYDTLSQIWRDSVTYKELHLDGAYSVEEFRYDSTTNELQLSKREVHATTVNPYIMYYSSQADGELMQVAEDFILYDTTIVGLLEQSKQTLADTPLYLGIKQVCIPHKDASLIATLHTLTGREVRKIKGKVSASGTTFSLQNLPQGVYVFGLMINSRRVTRLLRVR